jgi:hypothetical protein
MVTHPRGMNCIDLSYRLAFNVDKFLDEYNQGEICVSGDIDDVLLLIKNLQLDYTDYYEEDAFGITYEDRIILYIANRNKFGHSFMQLLRTKMVGVDRISEIYPLDL